MKHTAASTSAPRPTALLLLLLAAGSAGVLAWRKRRARTVSVDASAAT